VACRSVLAITNLYPSPERPGWGVFIEQQVKGLQGIGLDVHVFYVDRLTHGAGSYLRMLGPLRNRIDELRPSILHVMYGGVMADRIARCSWLDPLVITFHGSDLLGENLSGWARRWISRYGVHCSRRAARRADGVVVVSQCLKEALATRVSSTRLRVIPCGIDLARFKRLDRGACRQELGWDPDRFHVLFPADPGKTVKRAWLAAKAVDRLEEHGVRVELHYLRDVPNDQVPVWMNASDALLLTSAHEGSPTAVKEALACELPVVSVEVGDVAERITGLGGCHLALPTPEDLAAKLDRVRRTGERPLPRGQLQSLSLEAVARQLAAFYEELIQLKRGVAA
jgi:teichuronic acid biosynthesis glycosyltransferase TuaC